MIGTLVAAAGDQAQLQQFNALLTSTTTILIATLCYVAFAVFVFVRLRRWSDVPGRTTMRAVVVALGLFTVLEVFTRNPWIGWFLWVALAAAWVYYGLRFFGDFAAAGGERLRWLASRSYRRERRLEREGARRRAAELEASLAVVEHERRIEPGEPGPKAFTH
jgi:amino acid transporter